MTWDEIKDGYGLEQVLKEDARGLVCSYCLQPSRVLYTDADVNWRYGWDGKSSESFRRLSTDAVECIRNRCWCKSCAIRYFQD